MLLRKLGLVIASLLLLSASDCSCPDTDSHSENVSSKYIRVDARQEYTDTNVTITSGSLYSVSIKNTIGLCGSGATLQPAGANDFSTDASIDEWRPFPFMLGTKQVKLTVSGSYGDTKKVNKNGRGLMIYISKSPIAPPLTLDITNYKYGLNDDYTAFGGTEDAELIEFYQASGGTNELVLYFPDDAYVYYRYANNSLYKNEESILPDLYDPFEPRAYRQTLCDECVKVIDSGLNKLLCKLNPKELAACLTDTAAAATSTPTVPQTLSGGYSIGINYTCNVSNGAQASIGISGNPDVTATPWTPFDPGSSVGTAVVLDSGEMSEFVTATQSGTLRIKITDIFQSPSDLVIQNPCRIPSGCCSQQPFPLNSVFSGSINVGSVCGDINSVPVCPTPAPGADYPCGTIKGHGGFSDNIGFYDVYIHTSEKEEINRFFNPVIDAINGIIFGYCADGSPSDFTMSCIATAPGSASQKGLMQSIYETITTDATFIRYIMALIGLAVVLFSYTIMMNSVDKTFKESIYAVLRIGFVLILLQPDSWIVMTTYLFSIVFGFTDYVITSMQSSILLNFMVYFKGSVNFSSAALASAYAADESASIFDFFYYMYAYIFTLDNVKYFITAILKNPAVGLFYAIGCLILCFLFFLMVCRLVIVYLISKLLLSFLVILSPLYISFILFSKTRISFIKWAKSLLNFMFQPIFAFIPVIIVSMIFFAMFYQSLILGLSKQCLIPMFYLFELIPGIKNIVGEICILESCAPDVSFGNAINIIFTLFTLAYVLMAGNNIMGWMMKVCGSITIGFGDSGLERAFNVTDSIQKYAKSRAQSAASSASQALGSSK